MMSKHVIPGNLAPMHDTSTGSVRHPSLFKRLRIPLLLVVGVMTMGSGMGNPGCGSSSVPDCEEGCNIQGTYALSFVMDNPVPRSCSDLGLTLPSVLVIEREGNSGYVSGQLLDHRLTGTLYESTNTSLQLSTETTAPDGTGIAITVTGDFSEEARTATQPLRYSGWLSFHSRDAAEKCSVASTFTAFRQ